MATSLSLIRARLESDRARLISELEQLKSGAPASEERREGSPFGKREEEATEALEMEKRSALEQKVKEQLARVEHALAKFDKGTYGRCDNCGLAIDPARLEALPEASLCMKCKALLKNGRLKPPGPNA